jgi:hypothetical protein
MWDLVAATAAGVGSGLLFYRYFQRYASPVSRPREGAG